MKSLYEKETSDQRHKRAVIKEGINSKLDNIKDSIGYIKFISHAESFRIDGCVVYDDLIFLTDLLKDYKDKIKKVYEPI